LKIRLESFSSAGFVHGYGMNEPAPSRSGNECAVLAVPSPEALDFLAECLILGQYFQLPDTYSVLL